MLDLYPWQDFDRLRGEVDRLFGRYSDTSRSGQEGVVRPAIRLMEAEEGYRLSVDLPGVSTEAIDLEARGQGLRLRAARGDLEASLKTRYEQFLTLPEGADIGAIKARHANGVLELLIPKREEVRPRRVEILSGDAERPVTLEAGELAKPAAVGAPS